MNFAVTDGSFGESRAGFGLSACGGPTTKVRKAGLAILGGKRGVGSQALDEARL